MVRVNIGDYVTYISNVGIRYRGVVMGLSHLGKRVLIQRVATCKNRIWVDTSAGLPYPYNRSRIKSILPLHIAMQYKLKGL